MNVLIKNSNDLDIFPQDDNTVMNTITISCFTLLGY